MDKSDLLEGVFALLREGATRFCVIGGQAVNAYVEPLVSLDLDLAVVVAQIHQVRKLAKDRFHVEEFSHSLNISSAGSNLRVQIQTDPCYGDFVERAADRDVLGLNLPARHQDLLDIERILEAYPSLRPRVPEEILRQLS